MSARIRLSAPGAAIRKGGTWCESTPPRPLGSWLADWDLVRLDASEFGLLDFKPLQTQTLGLNHGETLWTAQTPYSRVGLAFPWAQLGTGIVVVSNLLEMRTNALLTDQSKFVSESRYLLHMATVVHGLNWQREVIRCI